MEKITSTIRVRMSAKDAHYGGELVDGAHMVHLFGDVATELLIKLDGDDMPATTSKLTARSTRSATLPATWYSKPARSSFPARTSPHPQLTSWKSPS